MVGVSIESEIEHQYTESDFDPHRGDRVSPTFCVLPWIHRFTNIGGEVQVCCVSEEYNNNNIDDDGIPLNVLRVQDDDILMNTHFMKNLRLEMMKGKWPRFCERCRVTEKDGGFSRRQFENATYFQFISRIINDTRPDGGIKVNIRTADYRLGNTCNLACRMCNPRSSSKWIKDWLQVEEIPFASTEAELDSFRRYKYYENPKIWESFRRQIPTLRNLHFAGGEPLVVDQMVRALKMCVDEGYAENIWLSYNTNLTYLPEEVKELWSRFHHVRIYASIDAYGELNDYIRYPSRWDLIHKNMIDLEENFEKYHLRLVLVNSTLQMYNVMRIDRLFKYLGEFERIIPIPKLINLFHPPYYSTQVLPLEMKDLVRERLKSAQAQANLIMRRRVRMKRYLFYLTLVDEAIHFMESEDRQSLLPAFFRAAFSKDRLRGESLFGVLPELRPLRNFVEDWPTDLEVSNCR